MRTWIILGLLGLATSADGQEVLPFPTAPFQPTGAWLEADVALPAVDLLEKRSHVLLSDVPLSAAETVDLDLSRVDGSIVADRVEIDGQVATGMLAELAISVWKGHVAGDPSSSASLWFSKRGCGGWVRRPGGLHHLVARPGKGGDWTRTRCAWVSDAELRSDKRSAGFCGKPKRSPAGGAEAPAQTKDRKGPALAPALDGGFGLWDLLECPVAIAADGQLCDNFGGDVQAELAYLTALMAAISDVYREEVGVVLTVPVLQLSTNSATDPWTVPDDPMNNDQHDLLSEFEDVWSDIPLDAPVAHMLSGVPLGGGAAYPDELCDSPYGVSAGIATPPSPIPFQQGPASWDFVVVAHEIGHTFGAAHTHEYCPPVDQCANPEDWGECQSQQICITTGTLMSYCNSCPGGISNMELTFHPFMRAVIREYAVDSCLAGYCGPALVQVGSFPALLVGTGLAVLTPCGGTLEIAAGSYPEAILADGEDYESDVVLLSSGGTVLIGD